MKEQNYQQRFCKYNQNYELFASFTLTLFPLAKTLTIGKGRDITQNSIMSFTRDNENHFYSKAGIPFSQFNNTIFNLDPDASL